MTPLRLVSFAKLKEGSEYLATLFGKTPKLRWQGKDDNFLDDKEI